MKSAVSLYEFMPYGAPELLESRQRHLSRALVLASTALLLLSAFAGGIGLLVDGEPLAPRVTVFDLERIAMAPPPLVEVARPVPATPVKRAAPSVGLPLPVPDAVAPPLEAPASSLSERSEAGTQGPAAPNDIGATGPPREVLPAWGEYVYVEVLPARLKVVKPDYPDLPLRAGVEGLVMVHVLIGKDGHVLDARLDERIQVPMLNGAALAAARQWVFTPGSANGRPVACWETIPFRFHLH